MFYRNNRFALSLTRVRKVDRFVWFGYAADSDIQTTKDGSVWMADNKEYSGILPFFTIGVFNERIS